MRSMSYVIGAAPVFNFGWLYFRCFDAFCYSNSWGWTIGPALFPLSQHVAGPIRPLRGVRRANGGYRPVLKRQPFHHHPVIAAARRERL